MKMSLYFLFYVVMVLELLIFIVERDAAEESVAVATRTMLDEMASLDAVRVLGTPSFKLGGNDTTTLAFHTFTLLSDSERAAVKYEIKRTYTLGNSLLGTWTDTTRWDLPGTQMVDTVVVHDVLRDSLNRESYVAFKLWRDKVTGDPGVWVLHTLPRATAERPVPPKALYEGSVEIRVLPILRRSFPEAFVNNDEIVGLLKKNWKITDIHNFWPTCTPATTRIDFRPTSSTKVGGGLGKTEMVH